MTKKIMDEASHYLREFDLEVTRYQNAKPYASIESVKELITKYLLSNDENVDNKQNSNALKK